MTKREDRGFNGEKINNYSSNREPYLHADIGFAVHVWGQEIETNHQFLIYRNTEYKIILDHNCMFLYANIYSTNLEKIKPRRQF